MTFPADPARTSRGPKAPPCVRARARRVVVGFALGLAAVLGLCVADVPAARADTSCQHARRHPRGRTARSGRRAPRRVRLTAAQRRMIRRWHRAPDRAARRAWSAQDPRPVVLAPIHGGPRTRLVPADDEGTFDAASMAQVALALASREGSTHPIHPRLVSLVQRAVQHFEAPYVHVVSGYREGNPSSRHGQGRAIDLVLPGVSDRRLATYLRTLGFVGVGIYPVSGFVHLDVRARSHFWSDGSGPSEGHRERPILGALAARMDAAARHRGEFVVPDVAHRSALEPGEAGEEDGPDEMGAAVEAVDDAAAEPRSDSPTEDDVESDTPDLARGLPSPDGRTDATDGAARGGA